jgi:chromatin assembly factor 1 subunit B
VPVMNNPTPSMSSVPSMTAAGSGASGPLPLFTPPQTPGGPSNNNNSTLSVVAGVKRESIASESSEDNSNRDKRRRIAPTLVEVGGEPASAPPGPPQSH